MHNTFISAYLGRKPFWSKSLDWINRFLRRLDISVRINSAWRSRMASVKSRMNLFHLATQVLGYGVNGDFVEIGCHSGESSVIIQKIIEGLDQERKFHVYDSFQGTPEVCTKDEKAYAKGEKKFPFTWVENADHTRRLVQRYLKAGTARSNCVRLYRCRLV